MKSNSNIPTEDTIVEPITTNEVDAALFSKIQSVEAKLASSQSESLLKEYHECIEQLSTEVSNFIMQQVATVNILRIDEKIEMQKAKTIISKPAEDISNLMIYNILNQPDPKSQEMAIIRWMNIANECINKGDYYAGSALYAGLSTPNVNNLAVMKQLKSKSISYRETDEKLNQFYNRNIINDKNESIFTSQAQHGLPVFTDLFYQLIMMEGAANPSPETRNKALSTLQACIIQAKMISPKLPTSALQDKLKRAAENNIYFLPEEKKDILKKEFDQKFKSNQEKNVANSSLSKLKIKKILFTSKLKIEKRSAKFQNLRIEQKEFNAEIKELNTQLSKNKDDKNLKTKKETVQRSLIKNQHKQANYLATGDFTKLREPMNSLLFNLNNIKVLQQLLSEFSLSQQAFTKQNIQQFITEKYGTKSDYYSIDLKQAKLLIDQIKLEEIKSDSDAAHFINTLRSISQGLTEMLNRIAPADEIYKYLDKQAKYEKHLYIKDTIVADLKMSAQRLASGEKFYKNPETYKSSVRLNDYMNRLEKRSKKLGGRFHAIDKTRLTVLKDLNEKIKNTSDIDKKITLIDDALKMQELTRHHADIKGGAKEMMSKTKITKKLTRPVKILSEYKRALEHERNETNRKEKAILEENLATFKKNIANIDTQIKNHQNAFEKLSHNLVGVESIYHQQQEMQTIVTGLKDIYETLTDAHANLAEVKQQLKKIESDYQDNYGWDAANKNTDIETHINALHSILDLKNRNQNLPELCTMMLTMSKTNLYDVFYERNINALAEKNITLNKIPGRNNPNTYQINYKDTKTFLRLESLDNEVAKARDLLKQNDADQHLTQVYLIKSISNLDQVTISEFCKNGNLAHPNDFASSTRKEKALAYMNNLFAIVSDFNKAGVWFTDIKPDNFMINDKDRLVISDTKSLILLGPNKNIFNDKENKFIPTQAYLPPEMYPIPPRENINIYNVQAYQIGLTLYEYLTGENISEKRNDKNEHLFNFDHPAFEGQDGPLLRAIIKGLTHTDPAKRLSLEQIEKMKETHQPGYFNDEYDTFKDVDYEAEIIDIDSLDDQLYQDNIELEQLKKSNFEPKSNYSNPKAEALNKLAQSAEKVLNENPDFTENQYDTFMDVNYEAEIIDTHSLTEQMYQDNIELEQLKKSNLEPKSNHSNPKAEALNQLAQSAEKVVNENPDFINSKNTTIHPNTPPHSLAIHHADNLSHSHSAAPHIEHPFISASHPQKIKATKPDTFINTQDLNELVKAFNHYIEINHYIPLSSHSYKWRFEQTSDNAPRKLILDFPDEESAKDFINYVNQNHKILFSKEDYLKQHKLFGAKKDEDEDEGEGEHPHLG